MINIIIPVKGLQKISDRLYIRACTFNNIYYYLWQVQQVPDKWKDACIILLTICNDNNNEIIHNKRWIDVYIYTLFKIKLSVLFLFVHTVTSAIRPLCAVASYPVQLGTLCCITDSVVRLAALRHMPVLPRQKTF